MASTDNRGYYEQEMAGLLGLLMVSSVALSESGFLSLDLNLLHVVWPAFGVAQKVT